MTDIYFKKKSFSHPLFIETYYIPDILLGSGDILSLPLRESHLATEDKERIQKAACTKGKRKERKTDTAWRSVSTIMYRRGNK